ncbi:MAG: hypothetical protein H0V49_01400 [Nocardioidaceae bacterium]|nr:hypothetical protein [Nocardioidaceae bacterium]
MSNPTRPLFIQATSGPCPAWCTDQPGHGYDGHLDDDEVRFHTREFPSDSGCYGSPLADLTAQERRRVTEYGVSVEIDPAHIWLYGDLDTTGPQARALAAAWIAAADCWDEVTSCQADPDRPALGGVG